MISIIKTDASNADFIQLVNHLDSDLAVRDGDEHAFYHQFNGLENLSNVVVLYFNKTPIGCGAAKVRNTQTAEIKRMYVMPEERAKGYATKILQELEHWMAELGYRTLILETGKKQPEAIALYKKNGYQITENYEPYKGVANSVCFRKIVSY